MEVVVATLGLVSLTQEDVDKEVDLMVVVVVKDEEVKVEVILGIMEVVVEVVEAHYSTIHPSSILSFVFIHLMS